jgi:hypothetical protein
MTYQEFLKAVEGLKSGDRLLMSGKWGGIEVINVDCVLGIEDGKHYLCQDFWYGNSRQEKHGKAYTYVVWEDDDSEKITSLKRFFAPGQAFPKGKTIKELGLDTSREFVVLNPNLTLKEGDRLRLEKDDDSECPYFLVIKRFKVVSCFLYRLAYAEEPFPKVSQAPAESYGGPFFVGQRLRMMGKNDGKGGGGALVFVAELWPTGKVRTIETDGTWGWKDDRKRWTPRTKDGRFWYIVGSYEGGWQLAEELVPDQKEDLEDTQKDDTPLFSANHPNRSNEPESSTNPSFGFLDKISEGIVSPMKLFKHLQQNTYLPTSYFPTPNPMSLVSFIKSAARPLAQRRREAAGLIESNGILSQQGKEVVIQDYFDQLVRDPKAAAAFDKRITAKLLKAKGKQEEADDEDDGE